MGKFIGIIAFCFLFIVGLTLLAASTYNLVIMIMNDDPYRYSLFWNIGGWILFIVVITFLGKKYFLKEIKKKEEAESNA